MTQRHLYFSFIFCLDLFWKENIKIIGGALSTNKQRPVWFWKNRETTAWKDRIFIIYFIFFICVKFNRLNDILWKVKYLPHDEFWLDTKKWQFWSEFCFSRGKRKITNSWNPLSFWWSKPAQSFHEFLNQSHCFIRQSPIIVNEQGL